MPADFLNRIPASADQVRQIELDLQQRGIRIVQDVVVRHDRATRPEVVGVRPEHELHAGRLGNPAGRRQEIGDPLVAVERGPLPWRDLGAHHVPIPEHLAFSEQQPPVGKDIRHRYVARRRSEAEVVQEAPRGARIDGPVVRPRELDLPVPQAGDHAKSVPKVRRGRAANTGEVEPDSGQPLTSHPVPRRPEHPERGQADKCAAVHG